MKAREQRSLLGKLVDIWGSRLRAAEAKVAKSSIVRDN
jgi:hypothetical protein